MCLFVIILVGEDHLKFQILKGKGGGGGQGLNKKLHG